MAFRSRLVVAGVAAVLVGAAAAFLYGPGLFSGTETSGGSLDPSELGPAEIPEFETWEELEALTQSSHARLGAFAKDFPDETLSVAVTARRGLTKEEIAGIEDRYGLVVDYVELTAGRAQGIVTLTSSVTLASEEAKARQMGVLGPGEPLLVTWFRAAGPARGAAALSSDPLVALVYADQYLDKIAGLFPEDAVYYSPRSIFEDYQRLAPAGAGEGEIP